MGPFDRFNDRAKRVLALAQDEAIRFNHDYIGPEHLLLALIREGEGVAARALDSLGIDLGTARRNVEMTVHRGEAGPPPSEITLHPRTKRVIELAVEEAKARDDSKVGTEHLLLGLIRVAGEDAGGVAAKMLASFGVAAERIRQEVIAKLGGQETIGAWRGSVVRGPARRSSESPEDAAAFREQQLTEVRRVIAVGQTRAVGDAALTLLSFEIYADGAVAQFLVAQRRPPDAPPDSFGMPSFRPALSDGRTQYASRSYGGSGGAGRPGEMVHWRMAQAFAPAVPEDVRSLKVSVQTIAWLGAAPTPTELVETSHLTGPWEWEIELGQ